MTTNTLVSIAMTPVEPPEDRDWGGDRWRRKRLSVCAFGVTLEYSIGSSPLLSVFRLELQVRGSDADELETLTYLKLK